jgi:hypothetical protein
MNWDYSFDNGAAIGLRDLREANKMCARPMILDYSVKRIDRNIVILKPI